MLTNYGMGDYGLAIGYVSYPRFLIEQKPLNVWVCV